MFSKNNFYEWHFVKCGGRVHPGTYEVVCSPLNKDEAKKMLKQASEQKYRNWELCRYRFTPGLRCKNTNCSFAHRIEDLAPQIQEHTWKRAGNLCQHYHAVDFDGNISRTCPFGPRCSYVHEISAEDMAGALFTTEEILDKFDHLYEKQKSILKTNRWKGKYYPTPALPSISSMEKQVEQISTYDDMDEMDTHWLDHTYIFYSTF